MKFLHTFIQENWIKPSAAVSAIFVLACLNDDEQPSGYSPEKPPAKQKETLLIPKAVEIYGKLLCLLLLNALCVLWVLAVLLFTINLFPGTGLGYGWMSPPFWLVLAFWVPIPFCVVTIGLTVEIGPDFPNRKSKSNL